MKPILITGPNKGGNDELLRQELRQYKATDILYNQTRFTTPRKKRGRVVVFRNVLYSDLARILEASKKFKVVATSETIDPSKRLPYQDHEVLQWFDIKDYWPTPTVNSISPFNLKEQEITITISKERAERISHGFSDILCWSEGFKAGVRSIDEYAANLNPFNQGINAIRDLQDMLKRELAPGPF